MQLMITSKTLRLLPPKKLLHTITRKNKNKESNNCK